MQNGGRCENQRVADSLCLGEGLRYINLFKCSVEVNTGKGKTTCYLVPGFVVKYLL